MILASLVQELIEFPEHLEADYETAIPSDVRMVELLVAIRDCRAGLATFADRVERDLLSVMGEKSMVVDGLGVVEIKSSKRRTAWQNDELFRRVVSRALDERRLDEETGEYESESAAVARVLNACARPSWRLEPLRALGLDPDEWCTVDEAVWSVKLPPKASL